MTRVGGWGRIVVYVLVVLLIASTVGVSGFDAGAVVTDEAGAPVSNALGKRSTADAVNGEVHDVRIVNRVDDDGDGYVSGFGIEVTANTQATKIEMSKGQKTANKILTNIFATQCPIPGCGAALRAWAKKTRNQRVFLVPGSTIEARTDHGTRDVARFHINRPDQYPGPGSKQETLHYTVGQHGENAVVLLPREAYEGPISTVLGSRDRTTIRRVTLDTCWNFEPRGGGFETGADVCLTPDEVPKNFRGTLEQYVTDTPGHTYLLPAPLKVESARMDRTASVTVTSNPSGATVYLDDTKLGETPWTGELPVDVGNGGQVSLRAEKPGYRMVASNVNIIPDPRGADPTGHGVIVLQKVTKPIAVTSAPKGATVTVDGNEVGTTPWSGKFWVNSRPTIDVDEEGYVAHRFENAKPGSTLHAPLVSQEVYDGATGTSTIDDPTLDFQDPILPEIGPLPWLTSYSNESDSYVTDLGQLDDPTLSFTNDTLLSDVVLGTDIPALLIAQINATPASPRTGQPVAFDGSGSFDMNGTVTAYRWRFGDGTVATGRSVAHTYGDDGTYTAALAVTDEAGNTATVTESVTVSNRPPTAAFGVDVAEPIASEPLTFSAAGSSDPDGAIASYQWDFDDGATATGSTVAHTFEAGGEYAVTLSVEDDDGNRTTSGQTIQVDEPNDPPEANLYYTEAPPGEVSFDAGGTGDPDGSVERYLWDFGDGTVGSGERVSHTYNGSGPYAVELLVVDDDGSVDVVEESIGGGDESGLGDEPTGGDTDDESAANEDDQPGASDVEDDGEGEDADSSTGGDRSASDVTDVETTTEAESPGFGVVAGVSALLVACLVLARRRR